MKRSGLPRGVFEKNGRFYDVRANEGKRKWFGLTRVAEGLPAMFLALAKHRAELAKSPDGISTMPTLIAVWQTEVMVRRSPKTQRDDIARCAVIAEAFDEFRPDEPEPPDCAEFLRQFRTKPRTFNAYRSLLRELFRFAEEKGKRKSGSNPVDSLRTATTKPRDRCPTTSELRRVKIGCLYGDDGKRTRSGLTMACLIELAYLSGQDISVMIRVLDKRDPQRPDEPHVTDGGIFFRRDKTGNAVEIQWTPRLRAVVAALRKLKAERMLKKRAEQRVVTPCLFTKQDGTPLTYEAASNAWQRGIKRSGVLPFMFRDIRAAALTDKEATAGLREANAMGAHATESQTTTYVRRRRARKTTATR